MKNWRTILSFPKDLLKDPSSIEYQYEDNNNETKSLFQVEEALAALLLNGAVFLNSNWWEDTWPDAAKKTVALCVNTNDVFIWGCADAECITYDEIEEVYRYWVKDPSWGTAIWAIIRNKELPQKPVADRIREAAIWDLDRLTTEHNLRPNYYDGISDIRAQQKREAYIAWCQHNSFPYDEWGEGWRAYTAAHPNWYSAEWKAEETRRCDEWRAANGYPQK